MQQAQASLPDFMAVLWLDLVEDYGVMLASRPYLVHLIQHQADLPTSDQLAMEHMQRLSTSCLSACHRTIALLSAAWAQAGEARAPHVLFCAAVLLMSNEVLPAPPKEESAARLPQATFILQNVAFMEGEVDGYAGDLLGEVNMPRDAIRARPGGGATDVRVVPSNGNLELQPTLVGARSSWTNSRAGDGDGAGLWPQKPRPTVRYTSRKCHVEEQHMAMATTVDSLDETTQDTKE
ncbi:uncharacterized protein J7T54_001727 [Emericellopsis cladophorae]|uniref:Uncharacterized protein n=1 Tax=Emericellopsis cladophorae TaxID=2686198 RepID=A0A9P9Y5H4_9HYPO|nr:uncharacterized protein J7T54_001727 [Emericellopsis cladophorae]KAI6783851.1 hypothetical protein J7T54_001727 [Emericellopsis cladophorae]